MAASKFRITKYGKAPLNILGGEAEPDSFQVDFLTHTIKMSLHTNSYVPNLDTHEVFSDLTNELSGGGYTAGGATLGSKTLTYTPANSFTARANSTAYAVGDIFRPASANGFLYMVRVAGTSAAAPPTFPTGRLGNVTDGTAEIVNVGKGISVVDSADIVFSGLTTTTARYGVIYRDTGTGSTSPLLYLVEFLASDGTTPDDAVVTAAALTIQLNALGIANALILPGVG